MNAVSVGGNTPVAMAGLMTGRWPNHRFEIDWSPERWTPRAWFGMRRFYLDDSEVGLPSALPVLAEQVRDAGYATAGVVSNVHLSREFHFDRGFDDYQEFIESPPGSRVPYGSGEDVTAAAVRYIHEAPDAPFFLYVHYMDAHAPFSPPEPYRSMFLGSKPPPGGDSEMWARWNAGEGASHLEADKERMTALYEGGIAFVDHNVGELRRAVANTGLADDTVFIITADHGEAFYEHGRSSHDGNLYEEIVHVPLLIHLPGEPGGAIESMTRSFDVMPTILEIAGAAAPASLEAVSLMPWIYGRSEPAPLVFVSFPWLRAMRTERYKLIEDYMGREEFYDLRTDPGERANILASEDRDTEEALAEIRAKLQGLLANLPESQAPLTHSEIEPSEEALRRLRSLGYVQ